MDGIYFDIFKILAHQAQDKVTYESHSLTMAVPTHHEWLYIFCPVTRIRVSNSFPAFPFALVPYLARAGILKITPVLSQLQESVPFSMI